ncbi:MAG TPA: 3'-5' exonuclease, partial [Herpetosiphonaceae bacterium]
ILAVTFTNKAAREMRERLGALLGDTYARDVMMGTFHSICARWLRRDIENLGRSRDFVVYDSDDQLRLMRQILKDMDLDEKQYPPRTIHGRISSAKNEMLTPAEYAQYANSYYDEIVTRCYEQYEKKLRTNNALDFDDLLLKTVQMFELNPAVLSRYQERYVHVMVDEVQDTNRVQYALINQVGSKYNNYFLIGDIQQSIYAWRGARLANVREFEESHPDVQIIPLEQNYRSTQPILDVAQAVIDAATERRHTTKIWSERTEGIQARIVEAYDGDEEARWTADEIQRLQASQGHSLDDFAVMYRTNAQSRSLEEALISRAIRYKLVGGTRFYERKEIKDILAYLRVIHNPDDEVSLLRIINTPGRGIGDKTQNDALGWAREMDVTLYAALHLLVEDEEIKAPFAARARNTLAAFVKLIESLRDQRHDVMLHELLHTLLDRLNYKEALAAEHGHEEGETRWENVQELHNVAVEYVGLPVDQQLATFLEEVALVADVDTLDSSREREPGVTLITLHQAKGLEYPVVFLVGLEEGLLPHSRSLNEQDSLEEERRLLYVGATRAKERLYLLYAFRRTMWGRTDANSPSRFLADIPDELVQRNVSREVKAVAPSHPPIFNRNAGRGPQRGQGQQLSWSSLQSGGTPAKRERPPRPATEARFSAGQKVRHAMFGDGVVISSAVVGDDEEVTVAFPGKGVKKLLAAFAKLEAI